MVKIQAYLFSLSLIDLRATTAFSFPRDNDKLDLDVLGEHILVTGGCDPIESFTPEEIPEEDPEVIIIENTIPEEFETIPEEPSGVSDPCLAGVGSARLPGRRTRTQTRVATGGMLRTTGANTAI